METPVLIIGAGPSGLVLALWLKKLGVPFRIVDKVLEPGTTSRALVVHARTLEFYQQLGIAEEVVDHALPFSAINLWVRGERQGRVALGDIGRGISPFPFMLIYPQDEHEKYLIQKLKDLGVSVERGIELLDFKETDAVTARLRHNDGREETVRTRYLVGCDGAHSAVRKNLDMKFEGEMYSRLFYVADVEAEGSAVDGELHLSLDDADFLAIFPLSKKGHARLIGTLVQDRDNPEAVYRWEDVSHLGLEHLKLNVKNVNWFSTYRVHHRLADNFHKGRAFLVGDAAHIHSPVGGQGMNTGIGDATNLAWKLAAVIHGSASASLLNTYAPERMAFARRLVSTTDRAFNLVTNNGPLARAVRTQIVPRILPRLLNVKVLRRFFFKIVSQTSIHYHQSALSQGQAGSLQGGDRLPWIGANFKPLTHLKWQVHVHGQVHEEIFAFCKKQNVEVYEFPWSKKSEKAGFAKDALYLVRPDGYIGLADPAADLIELKKYLEKLKT